MRNRLGGRETAASLAEHPCPSKVFSPELGPLFQKPARIGWHPRADHGICILEYPNPDIAQPAGCEIPGSGNKLMAARIPWGNRWLRVGVVSTPAGLGLLATNPAGCDLVELRIDMLISCGATAGDLETTVRGAIPPLLLTFRAPSEGGAIPADDRLRLRVLAHLCRAGTAIDFEYALLPQIQNQAPEPIARGAVLILSAHCFDQELSAEELEERIAAMHRIPAKIYKFASLCNTPAALDALETVQRQHPHDTTFMGMGDLAAESRKRLPPAGARLLYGFLDQPTAPGQPPVAELPPPPD